MLMNRYALIIGINDYEDRDNIQPLRYAVQDARRVDRFFHSCGFKVDTLTDSEATLDSIESKLHEIVDKMVSGDVFLFYFSGHGCELSVGRDRKQFLLPRNTQLRSLQFGSGSAIPLRFIQDCTNKSGVSRAIILDCCRSQIRAGVKGTDKSSVHYSSRDIKATAQSAPESSPLAIICSCHPDYQAYENSSLGGGIFTSAMISVLEDYKNKGKSLGFFPEIQKDIVTRTMEMLKETDMPLDTSLEPWVEGSAGGVVLVPGRSDTIFDDASHVKESPQKEKAPTEEVKSVDPRLVQQKIRKWIENREAQWKDDEWKDFLLNLYGDGCAVGISQKQIEQIRSTEKKDWLKAEEIRKAEEARIAEERRRVAEDRRRVAEEAERESRKATEEAERKRKEAEEVRNRRQEEQCFEEIKNNPTIPLCKTYLDQYSKGRYNQKVEKILDRLQNKRKYQIKRIKVITALVMVALAILLTAGSVLVKKVHDSKLPPADRLQKILLARKASLCWDDLSTSQRSAPNISSSIVNITPEKIVSKQRTVLFKNIEKIDTSSGSMHKGRLWLAIRIHPDYNHDALRIFSGYWKNGTEVYLVCSLIEQLIEQSHSSDD